MPLDFFVYHHTLLEECALELSVLLRREIGDAPLKIAHDVGPCIEGILCSPGLARIRVTAGPLPRITVESASNCNCGTPTVVPQHPRAALTSCIRYIDSVSARSGSVHLPSPRWIETLSIDLKRTNAITGDQAQPSIGRSGPSDRTGLATLSAYRIAGSACSNQLDQSLLIIGWIIWLNINLVNATLRGEPTSITRDAELLTDLVAQCRVDSYHMPEMGPRLVTMAQSVQRYRQVVMRGDRFAVQLQCVAIDFDGPIRLPLRIQRGA